MDGDGWVQGPFSSSIVGADRDHGANGGGAPRDRGEAASYGGYGGDGYDDRGGLKGVNTTGNAELDEAIAKAGVRWDEKDEPRWVRVCG